jgi:peptidoglycan/xylan/chitin deacetylase (PgdA/CDA1 family)
MRDSIVLCYHALSSEWKADLSTTPERFARQIELIVSRGYRGVRFSEAVLSTAQRTFAVTFDDAYHSVIDSALPILQELGIPGTVFVPTDYIGRDATMHWPGIDCWLQGPFEHELKPMSWDDIRSLASAGWEIGSHSCSHPYLTLLDDDALAEELIRSKAECERNLGGACTSLAYPYGDVDRRVARAAAEAGYAVAASLPRRLDSRDPMDWPRVGVYQIDGDLRFRLKMSPAIRRLRSSAAWDAIEWGRGLFGGWR